MDVSKPVSHNHVPDKSQIIASDLLVKMKRQIELDPLSPVSKIRDRVLLEELQHCEPGLKKEIISALPKASLRSTLHCHRNKILGYEAKSRDEYDPSVLF